MYITYKSDLLRGIVVIASASATEDRGFKYPAGFQV
jgi:hypothetical protein